MHPPLFDRRAIIRRRARFAAQFVAHRALPDEGMQVLADHVMLLGQKFETGCLVTPCPEGADQWTPLFGPFVENLEVVGEVPADDHIQGAPQSYDLLLIHLTVHALNDVPAVLRSWHRLLKPGGAIVGVFWGEDTLLELRRALAQVESNRFSSISPRVHPMITIQQMGALLSAAGFKTPILDLTRTRVAYPSLSALFQELRVLGETNALIQRRPGLTSPRFWPHVAAQFSDSVEVTCDWVSFVARS